MRKLTAADLTPGKSYRVIREFVDVDGITHSVGETWRFTAHNFLPYDDGLTLHVERDDRNHVFRMQWRDEEQGPIISSFSDYVEEC